MRKIIFLFLLCCASTGISQSFEGSISYSIITDVDPAMQQKMNDPAMQEQMKELKKQLEDPQFKAMMEANPKMKTQMEQALKMMENTDFSSMIPTGMIVKIKGKKSLTKIEGGMTSGLELLNTGDGKEYSINRNDKTYQQEDVSEDEYDSPETSVTKTSETKKILGYTCTKYIIESDEEEYEAEQFLWVTNEISGLNMRDFLVRKENQGQMIPDFKNIDGVPLRMEMGAQGMKMVMEATEVKRGGVSNSDFEIPPGFKKISGGY